MNELPILFDFKQAVPGRGFLAGVHLPGAALVREEHGKQWATGIHPMGVSAYGDSLRHAIAELKMAIGLALEDIAHEADDFASFEAEVQSLYEQQSVTLRGRFAEARMRVRTGQVDNEEDMRVEENPVFKARVIALNEGDSEPVVTDTEILKVG